MLSRSEQDAVLKIVDKLVRQAVLASKAFDKRKLTGDTEESIRKPVRDTRDELAELLKEIG